MKRQKLWRHGTLKIEFEWKTYTPLESNEHSWDRTTSFYLKDKGIGIINYLTMGHMTNVSSIMTCSAHCDLRLGYSRKHSLSIPSLSSAATPRDISMSSDYFPQQ